MWTAGTTKEFGVMAADSAQFDTANGKMSFESPKLAYTGKGVMSFLGTGLYFANMDRDKLNQPFDRVCLFLKEYLKAEMPKVAELMAGEIVDEDERDPRFCLGYMGWHNGHPVVANFSSYRDFLPVYNWSSGGLRFSSIIYADDSDKAQIFKETTEFMDGLAKEYPDPSPGLVGEILIRGIYHKADEEMKIGQKKKYAGGVPSVAVLDKNGIRSLSGLIGA